MLDENEASLNLDDLEQLFFAEASDARRAHDQLEACLRIPENVPGVLDVLWSDSAALQPAALHFKDSVDLFLAYCEILDVAIEIGYVTLSHVAERYRSDMSIDFSFDKILGLPALVHYYVEVSPSLLISSFAYHLYTSYRSIHAEEGAFHLFHRFLAIELQLCDNVAVAALIRHMDSVEYTGVKERVVSKILNVPTGLTHLLAQPREEIGEDNLVIIGIHDLLVFCLRLDSLLDACESWTSLRGSVRTFYVPFLFGKRYRLIELLEEAICQIMLWPRNERKVDQSVVLAEATRMFNALRRLASREFSHDQKSDEPPMASAAV